MEKISEQHIRLAKVQKLKKKILSEIKGFSNYLKEGLKEVCNDDRLFSEFFVKAVFEQTKLIYLKQFVNDPSFFMKVVMKDVSYDVIVYNVSDKHLDMFIDNDFLFTQKFLEQTSNIEITDLDNYLNDSFFEFSFVSTFEEMMHDKKISAQEKVIIP